MFSTDATLRSIIGDAVLPDNAEAVVPLSVDGSVPALAVAVGAGQKLVIPDMIVSAGDVTQVRLQVDRGSGFTDLVLVSCGANSPNSANLGTPKLVEGGAGVLVRLLAQTTNVAGTEVMATIGASTQP